MYRNLKAEFARKGITLEIAVAKLKEVDVNMSVPTLCAKMNGKSPITLSEAKALKVISESDLAIEVLFEEASE